MCLAWAWLKEEVVVGWLEGDEEERERVSVGWQGQEEGLRVGWGEVVVECWEWEEVVAECWEGE